MKHEMSILRDSTQDWLPIPLSGAEGVRITVRKACEGISIVQAVATGPLGQVKTVLPVA